MYTVAEYTIKLRLCNHEVRCLDHNGASCIKHVQVMTETQIPPRSEMIVEGRLNFATTGFTGLVESKHQIHGLMVAATVHRPTGPKMAIRLCNTQTEELIMPAGKIIGRFSPVDVEGDPQPKTQNVESELQRCQDVPQNLSQEQPAHLEELRHEWSRGLEPTDQQRVKTLLIRHTGVFSKYNMDVGRNTMVKHSIALISGANPIKRRGYGHGPVQEAEIQRQVQELLHRDLIEEGNGAWSASVVLVKKKDGKWQFCVDYRKLNDVSQKDLYPLPRITEALDALVGSKLFSTVDSTAGYWQVELDADTKERSAFVTRSGLWQWKVLPFGLISIPSTFERLVENIFRGLQWKTLLIYLDNVIVFSWTVDEHLQQLEEVFKRLKAARLKLKPRKCHLFTTKVNYLGHVIFTPISQR